MHYEKLPDGSVKCIEDEIPFNLPESWAWCRIKNICTIGTGATPLKSNSAYYANGTIPWITSAATSEEIITTPADYITERAITETNCSIYPIGTLIIAMYGEGKTRGQISELGIEACTNQACAALQILADDVRLSQYVKSYFQYSYENLRQKAKGGQQPNLNQTIIAETLIAIPPYQETKRIMDSVYQCIDQINTIEEGIESICTSIENAKKRILDLAIHGQLVPQNPADEPATVLLDRIRAEKEELIRQGKIKRDKKESVIFRGDDNSYYEKIGTEVRCINGEIPFDIPNSWTFVRLKHIGEIVGGGTPKTNVNEYWDGDIPWLTPADLSGYEDMYISVGARTITEAGLASSSAQLLPANSVLYSSRAPIGYVAISANQLSTNQGFKSVVPFDINMSRYLYYCLIARTEDIVQRASGTTFKEISGSEMAETIIPLPPAAEQKRIAATIQVMLHKFLEIEKSLS